MFRRKQNKLGTGELPANEKALQNMEKSEEVKVDKQQFRGHIDQSEVYSQPLRARVTEAIHRKRPAPAELDLFTDIAMQRKQDDKTNQSPEQSARWTVAFSDMTKTNENYLDQAVDAEKDPSEEKSTSIQSSALTKQQLADLDDDEFEPSWQTPETQKDMIKSKGKTVTNAPGEFFSNPILKKQDNSDGPPINFMKDYMKETKRFVEKIDPLVDDEDFEKEFAKMMVSSTNRDHAATEQFFNQRRQTILKLNHLKDQEKDSDMSEERLSGSDDDVGDLKLVELESQKELKMKSRAAIAQIEAEQLNSSESWISDASFDAADFEDQGDLAALGEVEDAHLQTEKMKTFQEELGLRELQNDMIKKWREEEESESCLSKMEGDSLSQIDAQNGGEKQKKEELDIVQLIHENELLFQRCAEKKLAQQTYSIKPLLDQDIVQQVLTKPIHLKKIGQNFNKRDNSKETCFAVSEDKILVGTTSGSLYVYYLKTEYPYCIYTDDGKEFKGNAITCLDVHPWRTEYVVIGYQRGQLSLVNLHSKKNIRVMKDHHKGAAVVDVKFADWIRERPNTQYALANDQIPNLYEDENAWMFISCDVNGLVVINEITSVAFGLFYADDRILVDPKKHYGAIYQNIATRFFSNTCQCGFDLDTSTVVALGCEEHVVIYTVSKEAIKEIYRIQRPLRYPSANFETVVPLYPRLPCITWGFGHTPIFKDKSYSILAIAWGPLVQLTVLRDIEQNEEETAIMRDGYYFVAPGILSSSKLNDPLKLDLQFESLHWLDQSLLIATTSNQDLRVLYTQKFQMKSYNEPRYLQEVDFEQLNSLQMSTKSGIDYTSAQEQVEMERNTKLDFMPMKSPYGNSLSQSVSVWQGNFLYYNQDGSVNKRAHLTWEDALGKTSNSGDPNDSWIETFSRALQIYLSKVKGLRGVIADDTRQDQMKTKLKLGVLRRCQNMIELWQKNTRHYEKLGSVSYRKVKLDTQKKYQLLIRKCIEFSVEIWDPNYLFYELLPMFVQDQQTEIFAEELKPFILLGHFSEWSLEEDTLRDHILQFHQQIFINQSQKLSTSPSSGKTEMVSEAENFEKILINLKFDKCSQRFMGTLIDFCNKFKLSTALMYLCIQTYGELGPSVALMNLRDFYLTVVREEDAKDTPETSTNDLLKLIDMPFNYPERMPLERSSTYIGLKILWAAKIFLLGKKFPKNNFIRLEWKVLVHDIADLFTQEDFIETISEINAKLFFQICQLFFTCDTPQQKFLTEERPESQKSYNQKSSLSMSHEIMLQRLTKYCLLLAQGHPVRLCFLYFYSNICDQYMCTMHDADFYVMAATELLKHSKEMLTYNEQALRSTQQTPYLVYRRLSRRGNHAPDASKHILLSEINILTILKRAQKEVQVGESAIDQIIEAADGTDFKLVRLKLYEMKQDYQKCLKILLSESGSLNFGPLQDGFMWIVEKHELLRRKAIKDNSPESYQFKIFEREVLNQTETLVQEDAFKAVGLCDSIFNGEHINIIERLHTNELLQYEYVKKVIEVKKDYIRNAVTGYSASKKSQAATDWQRILLLHITLICKLEKDNLLLLIRQIVKENFYPIEGCLKICQDFNQLEACAMLAKKAGFYLQSIKTYFAVLEDQLDIKRFRKELFYLHDRSTKERDAEAAKQLDAILQSVENKGSSSGFHRQKARPFKLALREAFSYQVWVAGHAPNIKVFDHITSLIVRIAEKHPQAVLGKNEECWQTTMSKLSQIANHSLLRRKVFCKAYLRQKMNRFCELVMKHVELSQIIDHMLRDQKHMRFRQIQDMLVEVYRNKEQDVKLSRIEKSIVQHEVAQQLRDFRQNSHHGILFSVRKCFHCNLAIDCSALAANAMFASLPGQNTGRQILLFQCPTKTGLNHAYHTRCMSEFVTSELSQMRKPQHHDMSNTTMQQYYRCHICFKHSLEIIDSSQKTRRMSSTSSREAESPHPEPSSSHLVNPGRSASISFSRHPTLRGLHRETTYDQWRENEQLKRMKQFEKRMMTEQLSLGDFNFAG